MSDTKSTESETPAAVAGAARGSATATRYEMALTEMARGRLAQHPHLQAEAIARHYTSHATIALQLLKMLECRQHTETWPELERSIQMLVDEIKTNHRHDLGIELEWPNARTERPVHSGAQQPETSKPVRSSELVRRLVKNHPQLSEGERYSIIRALEAGASHGYGNLISWLMTEWAVNLRDKMGMDEKTAIRATRMSPYPLPPNDAGERPQT